MNKKHNRVRVPVTLSLDLEYRDQYETTNGKGKLSELINAVLKEECEKQKNDEALDVLNLVPHKVRNDSSLITTRSNNTRQSTLFEVFATKDKRADINDYINSIEDKDRIDKIWLNSKVMYNIADTRRKKLAKGLIH